MSRLAKYHLVSTALSPILGAVAVDQIANGKPWTMWGWWLGLALLLVLVCHGLLRYAARKVQRQTIRIVEIEHNSQEMLAFLIAYLAKGREGQSRGQRPKVRFPYFRPFQKPVVCQDRGHRQRRHPVFRCGLLSRLVGKIFIQKFGQSRERA